MKLLGLIGYPLVHSYSPAIFQEIFKKEGVKGWDYRLFPISEIGQFKQIINNFPELVGLNVTTPYKQQVQSFCTWISPEAQEISSINTIKFERNMEGELELKGYNTDILGFEHLVKPLIKDGMRALILGTGGSANSIRYVLEKFNIYCSGVSRLKGKTDYEYSELTADIIEGHDLIINASPVGMYPRSGSSPAIVYQGISNHHICIDLIYNPAETQFLRRCAIQGAFTVNGMEMLEFQAKKGWEIFRYGNLG